MFQKLHPFHSINSIVINYRLKLLSPIYFDTRFVRAFRKKPGSESVMRLKRSRRQFHARDNTRSDVGQSYKVVETGAIHHVALTRYTKNAKGTAKWRNDEEARNGTRKKGIVPEKDGEKHREFGNERRTRKGRTRKGRDEERSGNRKKRGMGAGPIPLHALDASIFFANNVRVNYPHRYQSDEGGSRLRRCWHGVAEERPALISRQSEN